MRRVPRAVLLLLLPLLTIACYTPVQIGSGKVTNITTRVDLVPTDIHVSGKEEMVLVETAPPEYRSLVYDAEMSPLKSYGYPFTSLAFDANETGTGGVRIAALMPGEVHFLELPGFELKGTVSLPEVFRSPKILTRPGGGFVVVSSDRERPNVWILEGNPPKFTKSGRTELPRDFRGVAIEPETGYLLLTAETDGNAELEIFDLESMTTKERVELPLRDLDIGLSAADGWAWVGSPDGTFLPIQVTALAAEAPVHMGGPGLVVTAVSQSGRHLAVLCQDTRDRKPPYPTTLRLFLVDGATRIELLQTFTQLDGVLTDAEVLESSERVVFTAGDHLMQWYWRGRPK